MPELPVAKAYAAAPATGRTNQRAPEVFLGPRPCAESTRLGNRSATSISPSENLFTSAPFPPPLFFAVCEHLPNLRDGETRLNRRSGRFRRRAPPRQGSERRKGGKRGRRKEH